MKTNRPVYTGCNWWHGTLSNGLEFEAKVYDVGSTFGIQNGRVSKLSILDRSTGEVRCLVNYDRGWDKRPRSAAAKAAVAEVLALFPAV